MSVFTRSSKTKCHTKQDNIQYKSDKLSYLDELLGTPARRETPGCSLIYSSLISPHPQKKYTMKIIEAGDFLEVYDYNELRQRKDVNYEKIERKKINGFDNKNNKVEIGEWGSNQSLLEIGALTYVNLKVLHEKYALKYMNNEVYVIRDCSKEKNIELKNILRSKFAMERLVKANMNEFKTFITLTFADNIVNIDEANKKFDIFRTHIKALKRDFKYVCVPEFQKLRERKTGYAVVHYHLLTNLDIIKDSNIIIPQKEFTEKQLLEMSGRQRSKCYDVRYWNYGFARVDSIKDMNVVGYISKYMTKDIDNRLWGKRRYLYSQNLKKPSISYLDFNNLEDLKHYVNHFQSFELNFEKVYADKFGQAIEYKEYRKVVS